MIIISLLTHPPTYTEVSNSSFNVLVANNRMQSNQTGTPNNFRRVRFKRSGNPVKFSSLFLFSGFFYTYFPLSPDVVKNQFQRDMKRANMGSSVPDLGYFDVKQAPLAYFNCDECSKGYEKKQGLTQHKRCIHEGTDQVFRCKDCERVFKSYVGLIYHKTNVHDGLVYRCKVFESIFRNNANLFVHRQSQHEGFSLPCTFCGIFFSWLKKE